MAQVAEQSWVCLVCQDTKMINAREHLDSHINSNAHTSAAFRQNNDWIGSADPKIFEPIEGGLKCKLCDAMLLSVTAFDSHTKSKAHEKAAWRLDESTWPELGRDDPAMVVLDTRVYCCVCEKDLRTRDVLVEHLGSDKHKWNKDKTGNKQYMTDSYRSTMYKKLKAQDDKTNADNTARWEVKAQAKLCGPQQAAIKDAPSASAVVPFRSPAKSSSPSHSQSSPPLPPAGTTTVYTRQVVETMQTMVATAKAVQCSPPSYAPTVRGSAPVPAWKVEQQRKQNDVAQGRNDSNQAVLNSPDGKYNNYGKQGGSNSPHGWRDTNYDKNRSTSNGRQETNQVEWRAWGESPRGQLHSSNGDQGGQGWGQPAQGQLHTSNGERGWGQPAQGQLDVSNGGSNVRGPTTSNKNNRIERSSKNFRNDNFDDGVGKMRAWPQSGSDEPPPPRKDAERELSWEEKYAQQRRQGEEEFRHRNSSGETFDKDDDRSQQVSSASRDPYDRPKNGNRSSHQASSSSRDRPDRPKNDQPKRDHQRNHPRSDAASAARKKNSYVVRNVFRPYREEYDLELEDERVFLQRKKDRKAKAHGRAASPVRFEDEEFLSELSDPPQRPPYSTKRDCSPYSYQSDITSHSEGTCWIKVKTLTNEIVFQIRL